MRIAGYIPESTLSFSFTDEEELPEYAIEGIGFMRFAYSNLTEGEYKKMLQATKNYYNSIVEAKKVK